MSEWQRIIKEESIATLEKLADKFGHDVIDVEALRPAFDNFQMRLTPAALDSRAPSLVLECKNAPNRAPHVEQLSSC